MEPQTPKKNEIFADVTKALRQDIQKIKEWRLTAETIIKKFCTISKMKSLCRRFPATVPFGYVGSGCLNDTKFGFLLIDERLHFTRVVAHPNAIGYIEVKTCHNYETRYFNFPIQEVIDGFPSIIPQNIFKKFFFYAGLALKDFIRSLNDGRKQK
jgi:hypothetical protein